MTTHTLARTKTRTWDKITMTSIAAFAIGFAGVILLDVLDAGWTSWIQLALMILTPAAMIVAIIGSVKVFGGLKAGITLLIIGVVLYIVGRMLVELAGTVTFLGGEISNFNDPAFIIGQPMVIYGFILGIVGLIATIVTYLRRVLKAVEGNKVHAGS